MVLRQVEVGARQVRREVAEAKVGPRVGDHLRFQHQEGCEDHEQFQALRNED